MELTVNHNFKSSSLSFSSKKQRLDSSITAYFPVLSSSTTSRSESQNSELSEDITEINDMTSQNSVRTRQLCRAWGKTSTGKSWQKCSEMQSQSIYFSKFFWGHMPPDPLVQEHATHAECAHYQSVAVTFGPPIPKTFLLHCLSPLLWSSSQWFRIRKWDYLFPSTYIACGCRWDLFCIYFAYF